MNVITLNPNKKRCDEIKGKIAEISETIDNKTHNLIIYLTAAPQVANTTKAIYQLDNRLVVRNFLKTPESKSLKNLCDRLKMYKYPYFHVLIMSPALFSRDSKYINLVAKVNKIFVMSDCKENYTLYNP